MTKTKENLNIHQRILAVMDGVSYIQKGDKKVNNQYTFAGHDAVTAAARPHFIKHGVLVISTILEQSTEWKSVKDKYGKDKLRGITTMLVGVSFINVDDPADKIDCKFLGHGIDDGDKGPGKAMSYAYKYAILKTLSLETGDDPEKENMENVPAQQAEKVDPKQAAEKQEFDKLVEFHKENMNRLMIPNDGDGVRNFAAYCDNLTAFIKNKENLPSQEAYHAFKLVNKEDLIALGKNQPEMASAIGEELKRYCATLPIESKGE